MKHLHRNQKHRSAETEKKGRKIKTHRSEEACKCYTPLVKLHWHDCPVLRKPCPIHGNNPHQRVKEEKVEPEQNITISFHPSSKTERLFQPVKNLLAHCSPDTKINFQYFSPKDFASKESVRHQFIQTSPEEVKRTLSNNVFVEKTKSFVADKTNKMKKLKQCFHSPCNSIVQKTRSQTSVRDKIYDSFREEAKQKPQVFFNMAGDEPFDVKYDTDFESLPCNKSGLRNLKKLSNEKKDSDFITVTHNGKENVINHKIFEIKHRKGLNDINFVDYPKQPTQFVYSAFNGSPPRNESTDHSSSRMRKFSVFRKTKRGSDEEESKDEKISSSEKLETSSSGSLYMTPFVLMPKMEEVSNKKADNVDEAVQVEVTPEKRHMSPKQTQTSIRKEEPHVNEKLKTKNVSLQTLPLVQEKYSQCTKEIFMHDFDSSEETLNEKYFFNEKPSIKRTISDESFNKNKWPEIIKEKKESSKYTKTTEVQTTSGYRYKEVLVTCWDRNLKHETSQTEPIEVSHNEHIKTCEPLFKKHITFYHKETQTSFFTTSEFSEISKYTTLDFSNATVVINSDQPEFYEFQRKMPKTWWGKSYSESDLCKSKGKCGCQKTENVIPLFQSCLCKDSDLSPYMSSFKESFVHSTSTKIFETGTLSYEHTNCCQVRNLEVESKKQGEELPKKEQTSTKEDLTAAISDLSELKRIIQEFFEKAEFSSKKCLENEKRVQDSKIDSETMTDFVVVEKPKQKLNAEAQTTVQVLLNEELDEKLYGQKVKFRRSVLLDDENQTKTFFICALCGREINTSVSVSTNTDKPEKHSKAKGKTTVVDTEYSETITVKTVKKTQNADASKNPKADSKPVATLEEESSKILKRGQSTPQPTNTQKSGIPIPVFSGTPFSKNDDRVTLTECQNPESFSLKWEKGRITSSHSKPKSIGQKSPTVSQCVCREIPGTSSGSRKTTSTPDSPPTSRLKPKTQINADPSPSVPKSEHQGVQWQNSEQTTSKTERKAVRRPDEFIYPVIIRPLWPKDFMRTWQSMEDSDDSKWTASNQKRSYDKVLESIDVRSGKKIKAVLEEPPKECFKIEKPALFKSVKKRQPKASLKKSTGFIWIPTSASQIFSKKNFFHKCKITKSEESVKMKHQPQGSAYVRHFNGVSSNDTFSGKKCHLRRIPFANNDRLSQPECGCCKSLTYWKTDNDDVLYPPRSTGKFAYQVETPREGRSQLTVEVSEEQISKNLPTPRFDDSQNENFFNECLYFSEGGDSVRTSENNFSDDEISETYEEIPYSHSQEPPFSSQNHTLEESFYFDVDSSQKPFWIKKNTKKNGKSSN